MIFLENPARKRRRTRKAGGAKKKRRPPKGFKSWKTYMASIRPGAKKKKRATTKKRRTRRRATTKTEGTTMARRKRRTTRRRSPAKRRTRRRSYRRNPPLLKGFARDAMNGAAVTAGKAATRIVADKLPMLPKGGALGLASQFAVALGVGWAAKFAPAGARSMIRAGAYGAVIEDAVQGLNIPLLSGALDAYPSSLNAYPQLAALPGSLPEELPDFAGDPFEEFQDY